MTGLTSADLYCSGISSFLALLAGVRATLTNVLETPAGTGPFVRTHMAPITVTAAMSTEEDTVRMPFPINTCQLLGISGWPKE